MPIGSYASVPYLVQHLIQCAPRSVLDLGIGCGGNGAIVRQWLDLGVQPWKTFLAGVEVWPDYRSPLWDLYSLVIVDTIENYFQRFTDSFDCILLTDVLEHFDMEPATDLLRTAQQRITPGGLLLVGTPAAFFEQGPWYGNPHECHRSAWTEADLQSLGFETQRAGRADWFCGEAIVGCWRRNGNT